jgi:hypothetical protein
LENKKHGTGKPEPRRNRPTPGDAKGTSLRSHAAI